MGFRGCCIERNKDEKGSCVLKNGSQTRKQGDLEVKTKNEGDVKAVVQIDD